MDEDAASPKRSGEEGQANGPWQRRSTDNVCMLPASAATERAECELPAAIID